ESAISKSSALASLASSPTSPSGTQRQEQQAGQCDNSTVATTGRSDRASGCLLLRLNRQADLVVHEQIRGKEVVRARDLEIVDRHRGNFVFESTDSGNARNDGVPSCLQHCEPAR